MRRLVVLLGAPGAGKGTLADLLTKHFEVFRLSTGELLRAKTESDSPLGRQISERIDAGRFVPDDLIVELVRQHIEGLPRECVLVLDGFPRTLAQAEVLDELMSELQAELVVVYDIQVSEAEIERRVLHRASQEKRKDDSLATLQRRLRIYHERTEPLRRFFAGRGKLLQLDGMGSPHEVLAEAEQDLRKRLFKQGFGPKKEAG